MTPDELRGAVDLGVCYVTHLFNAMSALHHRTPGAVGAALDTPGTVVGLVCDGHHVDAVAVRLAARALGPHRVSLVSDASPALDAPRGTLRLGRHEVTRGDTGPRLADGTLAGSAIGLDEAVRTYREMVGCTVPEALAPVTSTPAALLGLPDRGILAPGAAGDVVVLDESLAVRCTVLGGTVAWRS